AAFELAHQRRPSAPSAAGQAALGVSGTELTHRQQPGVGAARRRGTRVERTAFRAEQRLVAAQRGRLRLEDLGVLVHDAGAAAEEQPARLLVRALARDEPQLRLLRPDRPGEVDGAAPLAGAELEGGMTARRADLVTPERHVRTGVGPARVRVFRR